MHTSCSTFASGGDEEEGGAGPIPHFYETPKVFYPNISFCRGKYTEYKAFSVFGDFIDQEILFDVMPPSLRYFHLENALISYGSANSGKKFTLFGTDLGLFETIYVPPGSKNNSKLLSSFKAENEDVDDNIEFSMFI